MVSGRGSHPRRAEILSEVPAGGHGGGADGGGGGERIPIVRALLYHLEMDGYAQRSAGGREYLQSIGEYHRTYASFSVAVSVSAHEERGCWGLSARTHSRVKERSCRSSEYLERPGEYHQ